MLKYITDTVVIAPLSEIIQKKPLLNNLKGFVKNYKRLEFDSKDCN